jgi:hypothetical protein
MTTGKFEKNVFINCPFDLYSNFFIKTCKEEGYDAHDIDNMPLKEYMGYVKKWFV